MSYCRHGKWLQSCPVFFGSGRLEIASDEDMGFVTQGSHPTGVKEHGAKMWSLERDSEILFISWPVCGALHLEAVFVFSLCVVFCQFLNPIYGQPM